MVDIQAKEIIDKMSEDLKVQPAMQLPRELGKQILPVFNVNPERLIKIDNLTLSDGTSATMFTTNATKKTFLVGCLLSVTKDVFATSTSSDIIVTPKGDATRRVMILRYEPVTAGEHNMNIIFPFPIELEPSTAVTLGNSLGVASIDTEGIVYFFEVDPQ